MRRRPVVSACGAATLAAAVSWWRLPAREAPRPLETTYIGRRQARGPRPRGHDGDYSSTGPAAASGSGRRAARTLASSTRGSPCARDHPEWSGRAVDGAGAHRGRHNVFRIQAGRTPACLCLFAASREGDETDRIAIASLGKPHRRLRSRRGEPFLCASKGPQHSSTRRRTGPPRVSATSFTSGAVSEPSAGDQIRVNQLTANGLSIRPGGAERSSWQRRPEALSRRRRWSARRTPRLFASGATTTTAPTSHQVWSVSRERGTFRSRPTKGRLSHPEAQLRQVLRRGRRQGARGTTAPSDGLHAWKTWDVTPPDNEREAWTGRVRWRGKDRSALTSPGSHSTTGSQW